MTSPRLPALASAVLLLGLTSAASAQTASTAQPAAVDTKASDAPVNDQAAQDRIMALVRAGKCGPAKAEATRVGDLSLADQIGTMCGAHSSDPFAKGNGSKGGGGGRRGGGSGGGGPG